MPALVRLWTEIASWRWSPAIALASGALVYVFFAVVAIPEQIGSGAPISTVPNRFAPLRQQRASSFAASISPSVGESESTLSAPRSEPVAHTAPPARAMDPAHFPRRGFTPPLDRPEPPPPPPPPPPSPAPITLPASEPPAPAAENNAPPPPPAPEPPVNAVAAPVAVPVPAPPQNAAQNAPAQPPPNGAPAGAPGNAPNAAPGNGAAPSAPPNASAAPPPPGMPAAPNASNAPNATPPQAAPPGAAPTRPGQ